MFVPKESFPSNWHVCVADQGPTLQNWMNHFVNF